MEQRPKHTFTELLIITDRFSFQSHFHCLEAAVNAVRVRG